MDQLDALQHAHHHRPVNPHPHQLDEADEEVATAIDATSREVDGLELENKVLEEWLKARSDNEVAAAEAHEARGRGGRRNAGRRAPPKLAIEQKCEVSAVQMDAMTAETENLKRYSDKLVDTLKAVLEETDLRIGELKKDAYEFKRDIVVGAENMRTGKTMAEKVQKYMEDKLKGRDAMIDKLKLKNVTLKAQIQKVEQQLKQKEELGDALHYIDFHQLQIENKQYVARIEERNEELLKLKMSTGAAVQSLNTHKDRLSALKTESEWLHREIAARTEQLAKSRADHAAVQAEIVAERKQKKRLSQQQHETADMPQVLDYVTQKAQMYELESALRNWERKVEIMEMAAKRARTIQRQRGDA